jgi:periplasmic copper chaperone A
MQSFLTPSPKTASRVLHLGAAIISAHSAGGEAVKISDAWVHAATQVGGDVALSMTIKNEADVADALLRVRCPVANLSEKHKVDRGEGSLAMRGIPSIRIAAGSTTVLKPDPCHVMLLQTRHTLAAGEAFQLLHRFSEGRNDRHGGESPRITLSASDLIC